MEEDTLEERNDIMLDHEEVVSCELNEKLPWALIKFYTFNIETIGDANNKVKCRGCNTDLTWNINEPSSNLLRHINTSKPIIHAQMRLDITQHMSNSPKFIKAKKRLDDVFDSTSTLASPLSKISKLQGEKLFCKKI